MIFPAPAMPHDRPLPAGREGGDLGMAWAGKGSLFSDPAPLMLAFRRPFLTLESLDRRLVTSVPLHRKSVRTKFLTALVHE